MSRFCDHFDRVVVISLPQREERRERLAAHLEEHSLASPDEIHWVEAVDGKRQVIPKWVTIGAGGWGCRLSHLKVIKQAREDGIEKVLILEDDVFFDPNAGEILSRLMPLVPDDWDFFYLGGQHMEDPHETTHPAIVKGSCITRTHAYAIHQRVFDSVIEEVENDENYRINPGMHLDHHYGCLQNEGRWNAYSPSWWIAGQEAGLSDISSMDDPRRWWYSPSYCWLLPFVFASKKLSSHPDLYHEERPFPEGQKARLGWMRIAAREALIFGKVPALPRSLDPEEHSWVSGIHSVRTPRELEKFSNYAHRTLSKQLGI